MSHHVPNPGQQEDFQQNKAIAILAYIIFFLPLLTARDSKFAMYHANQGFLVFLTCLAVNIIGTIIPLIGWFIIVPFGNLFVLVLILLGILNAANGQMKPLPLIGKFEIIK
ncbi:hypothetical protein E0485_07015 [Paenibacillus albiflavus]|uniref:DUF4870 domain-containing protein n=1 Tax=Paenibacillus albiflavus TaxID=2545760 RepID=A0A4R4EHZ3_9BACL|nr:hypothetical protein [Paenibacillus albiflavus]TCZ78820.1 hypothetical protein E0485_07015 [Paenibacillus albiflavus]